MGSKNKETGEFEYDVDNDEKSGYTNAFRRAAQDAWGIGRYLYKKGIPTFLDPRAVASVPAASACNPTANRSAPPKELADRSTSPPTTRPEGGGQPPKSFDNFKIPPAGKSVFAWCKEMEKTFETALVDGMGRDGEAEGWGRQFNSWNQTQVNTICLKVIKHLRELPTYKGQFESFFPGGVPDAKIPTTTGSGPNTPPPTLGVNIADLRKTLMTKMQALVMKQTGQPADNPGLKVIFQAIGAASVNSSGYAGEIPESLGKLTDVVWLNNMLSLIDRQIDEAVAGEADPDCPF